MPNATDDKDAIREVLAEYCFALDTHRFADMAALFSADGTWDTAFGKATGHAAIVELVGKIGKTAAMPSRPIHMVANIVIRLNGDGAQVLSNWTLVQNSDEGLKIGSAGAYEDQMVRRDGKWLFHYRKIDRFIA